MDSECHIGQYLTILAIVCDRVWFWRIPEVESHITWFIGSSLYIPIFVINVDISVKKKKPKPKRFGDKVLVFPQQNKNNFVQYKVPTRNKGESLFLLLLFLFLLLNFNPLLVLQKYIKINF